MNVKRPLHKLAVGGDCHVFEVAQSVYKYASNRLSFRAQPKNFVILRVSKDLVETKRQTFSAPVPKLFIIHYSLLIIMPLRLVFRL